MARMNFQVATGKYTSAGAASSVSVGFQPDFVFIKGVSQHPVFRLASNKGDDTAYFANNVSNLTGGITGMTSTGFNLGTDVTVNNNGTVYYWVAIKGYSAQSYFYTGRYTGNGTASSNFTATGISFTPEFMAVKRTTAIAGIGRLPFESGDLSGTWTGAHTTNQIQAFISNGFTLGSNTDVNASGNFYQFMVARSCPNIIATGSYVGNGTSQSITGLGFSPGWVILKDITGSNTGAMRTADMTNTTSVLISNGATQSTVITSLDSSGFSVGSSANANNSGNTYSYIAFASGNFNLPLSRNAVT